MPADVTRRSSRVPPWAVLTFGAGAVALTWWITTLSAYHGPDHLIGPFHIPLALEWAVGGSAVGLAVLAAVVITKSHVATTVDAGLSGAAAAWLITASIVIGGCWRVVTSGVNGANIGGGLVCLAGPFAVAYLLQLSVLAERRARSGRLQHVLVVSATIWLAAVLAAVALWFLPG